jgi:uncharacterized protein involved in exopolysaccharide biosynthesis
MMPAAGGEGENVITIQRIVRAVRRRLGVMLAVFALTFAFVAINTFQLQASYTATSRVIINSRGQQIVDIGAVISGMPANAGIVDTEAEILRSRSLIEKVVTRLDLINNPEFNYAKAKPSALANFMAGTKAFIKGLLPFGKGDAAPAEPADPADAKRAELDGVITAVRNAINVNRLGSTFIIEISANSHDPKMAATLRFVIMCARTPASCARGQWGQEMGRGERG